MRGTTQGQRNTLVGISPTTFALDYHCSTIELTYKARREQAVGITDVTPQQMKMNINLVSTPKVVRAGVLPQLTKYNRPFQLVGFLFPFQTTRCYSRE